MKAILTKFQPATNTRGSRIVAYDGDNRVSIPYPHDARDNEHAHRMAAEAFMQKLNWSGDFVSGGTKDGYAHVFTGPAVRDLRSKAKKNPAKRRVYISAANKRDHLAATRAIRAAKGRRAVTVTRGAHGIPKASKLVELYARRSQRENWRFAGQFKSEKAARAYAEELAKNGWQVEARSK